VAGSQASNQALAQSSEERRYPALLALGAERLVGVIDGLVDLFDKLLADTNANATVPGNPRRDAQVAHRFQRPPMPVSQMPLKGSAAGRTTSAPSTPPTTS